MAGNQSLPGYLCQEEAPVDVRDGTLSLTASPSGVTEEDVSYEIRGSYAPVPTTLTGLNPAEMQVLAWMRKHRPLIVAAEQRFRVDRRAIAGAIAWEMLENVVRNPKFKISVGEGKVHTYFGSRKQPVKSAWVQLRMRLSIGDPGGDTSAKEVEELGYLPPQSFESRLQILATTEGAVTYIAAMMAASADLAAQHGFDDIRGDPIILTNVYHGRTLRSWDAALAVKPRGAPFAGGNPMDVWLSAHMAFIEDGVGRPDLPESGATSVLASFMMPADPGALPSSTPHKTLIVPRNSSLSAIAMSEYGSHDLWPLIHDLNKAKLGPNPNLVALGTTLEIAPLASYTPAQVAWARSVAPTWRLYR